MKKSSQEDLSTLTVTPEGVIGTQEVEGDGASKELASNVISSETNRETTIEKTAKIEEIKKSLTESPEAKFTRENPEKMAEAEVMAKEMTKEANETPEEKFDREHPIKIAEAKAEITKILKEAKEAESKKPLLKRGWQAFKDSWTTSASRPEALEIILNDDRWVDYWAYETKTPAAKEGFIKSVMLDRKTNYRVLDVNTGKEIRSEHGPNTVDAQ